MIQRHMLLRLPEQEGAADFALRDSAGKLLMSGTEPLERLAELGRSVPMPAVRVLVPGTRVLLTRARVPTRNPRALQRALPYALEDQLAGDVDTLHCVPGAPGTDDTVPVAVVERACMDDWTSRLKALGLDARALIPETAVLPVDEEGGWLLWLEGDQAWLALGPGEGMALDRDNAAVLTRLRLDETTEEARPVRIVVVRHGAPRDADSTLREEGVFGAIPVQARDSDEPLLEVISRTLPPRPPFNLLTGPYSRREQLGRLWRPWRLAVIFAALWAGVQLVQLHTEIRWLNQEQARLDQRMQQVYESAVPGSRAGADPRRQMESALMRLGGGEAGGDNHDFQAALAHVAPVLVETAGFRIESLRYRPGQMDLDLRLESLQALDGLKQRLEGENRWTVEIVSANTHDDYVESRIQLRRAGS